MVKQQKFPLSAEMLNRIKRQIRNHSLAYATDEIPIDQIGAGGPGERILVESHSWPIGDAIEYFQKEGAGKREDRVFKILNPDYFGIELQSLSVPITFSVDERIRADLSVMVDVYSQIYDIENRMRFHFHEKLKSLNGGGYFDTLPRKVRQNIEKEKNKPRKFVDDTRSLDLQYAQFDDLKRILDSTPDLVSKQMDRETLLLKLDYLFEARNYVAHNNLLLTTEVVEISEACGIVRRIVERASK